MYQHYVLSSYALSCALLRYVRVAATKAAAYELRHIYRSYTHIRIKVLYSIALYIMLCYAMLCYVILYYSIVLCIIRPNMAGSFELAVSSAHLSSRSAMRISFQPSAEIDAMVNGLMALGKVQVLLLLLLLFLFL